MYHSTFFALIPLSYICSARDQTQDLVNARQTTEPEASPVTVIFDRNSRKKILKYLSIMTALNSVNRKKVLGLTLRVYVGASVS